MFDVKMCGDKADPGDPLSAISEELICKILQICSQVFRESEKAEVKYSKLVNSEQLCKFSKCLH